MKTILLVEDRAVVREPLAAALAGQGHRVLATDDGTDALRLLVQSPPDLVVLDINLPGIDGLSILKQIRATNTSLPVIMLTAVAEKHRVLEAMKLGFSSYMLKSRFSL